MSFANQRISAAQRARFDFDRIKRAPDFIDPAEPEFWTVDHERSVFLIGTGHEAGAGRDVRHFVLWWGGSLVPLELEHKSTGRADDHVVSTWRLRKMNLPHRLERSRPLILGSLKSALSEYQLAGTDVPMASHEARFKF